MKTYDGTMSILNSSKQFKFEYNEDSGRPTVLAVTDYYTGESVKLDLSRLTPEMLDELQIEDSEDEY